VSGGLGRVVSEADVQGGRRWCCEACNKPFHVGDEVFGRPVAFSHETVGEARTREGVRLDPDEGLREDDPIIILGEYRCARCFMEDRPLISTGED
jgi:hypothetical protein